MPPFKGENVRSVHEAKLSFHTCSTQQEMATNTHSPTTILHRKTGQEGNEISNNHLLQPRCADEHLCVNDTSKLLANMNVCVCVCLYTYIYLAEHNAEKDAWGDFVSSLLGG